MDARALLTSQGWRGTGHSLHKTDDGIGLAKPILVSRKNNTLGVGRKNHVTSDQWWLNAFDEQLKSLDTSNKTSIVQTKTNTRLDGLLTHGAGKYTGANALYSCFVSGGQLQGTIRSGTAGESTDATPEAEVAPGKKESKEQRRARKAEKRRKKAAKAEKLAKQSATATEAWKATESKAESKPESNSKSKSKKGKKHRDESAATETKEERRARKEAKRKAKAKKEMPQKVEKG